MHFGPSEALAAIKVKFEDALTTVDLERVTDEIEERLRAELPILRRIYIEAGRAKGARGSSGEASEPRRAPVDA